MKHSHHWLGLGSLLAGLLLVAVGCASSPGTGPGGSSAKGSNNASGGEGSGKSGEDGGNSTNGGGQAAMSAPPKGTDAAEKRHIKINVSLTLFDKTQAAGSSKKHWEIKEERGLTIIEVGKDAATKLDLLYGKHEGDTLAGHPPPPTTGKRYWVQSKGGAIEVTSNGGGDVSDDENKYVLAEYSYLGKPQPVRALLAKNGLAAGEKISLNIEALRNLVGYLGVVDLDAANSQATFQGWGEQSGRSVAKLDLMVKGSFTENDLKYELDMQGPAHVDKATGWVVKLNLTGKLAITGTLTHKGKKLNVKGKGTVDWQRTAEVHK
jgi:hypothetical protein